MKNKVKFYREKAGLTQQGLSDKSGVSRNTISNLETQEDINVTYEIMEKISNALGYKPATIFFSN